MNLTTAHAAIEAILATIPDDQLPEFDRVEHREDGEVVVWFGGQGRVLGTAKSNRKRDPLIYRGQGATEAIQAEMAHRADKKLLDNGDNPNGVQLARVRLTRKAKD